MKDQLLKRGKHKIKRWVLGKLYPPDRNYHKYILLCRGRTGSNYLLTLLNNHPEITCYAEPFRNALREKVYPLLEKLGKSYMDEYIYKAFPRYVQAVGLKIFYTHARYTETDGFENSSTGYGPVWDYLVDDQSLKVIQLTRTNLLRVYLSELNARNTGVWYMTDEKDDERGFEPIYVDFEDCINTMSAIKNREREFSKLFKDHPKLDVTYEQLIDNREDTLKSIQQFLGVTTFRLDTSLKRQNKRSLSESIANYAELKAKFKGTEWEGVFED